MVTITEEVSKCRLSQIELSAQTSLQLNTGIHCEFIPGNPPRLMYTGENRAEAEIIQKFNDEQMRRLVTVDMLSDFFKVVPEN